MESRYKQTAEDLKKIFDKARGKRLETIEEFKVRIDEEGSPIAVLPDNFDQIMYGNAFDDFFRKCYLTL